MTSKSPTASAQMSVVPSTVDFGNIVVGQTNTQTVTVSNSGNANLTITQAPISDADFTVAGVTLPVTLDPGQQTNFNIAFTPASASGFTGTLSLVSNATNSPDAIPLSGKGVTAASAQMSVVPSSVAFGNVVVGQTNTQTVTLTNSGNANLTITQATVSGSGFTVTGLTLPVTLDPGQQTNSNIAFVPTSASSFTGTLSLVSNASDSPDAIPLSGKGVTASQTLSVNPNSLSFGNVTVGQTATKSVTVSSSGNSSVNVSQVNVSGAGFSASGLTAPVTLDAGQSVTVSVVFAPTTTGSVTGSVSIVSDATNSPSAIALDGSGVSSTSHSVTLSWTASTSTVAGYDVYRGSQSGGPYAKVNSSIITTTSFTDSTVQAGQTYYYVTTAVDSNNVESSYSNQVSATIPNP